jgi:hypothetical protein
MCGKRTMPLYQVGQFSTTRRKSEFQRLKIQEKIGFYYVLGADKPVPTIPSDQGFYHLLWDDLDRSTCSLKQTAHHK